MHKTGQDLLKLMFREGETICVSPNKYGYHSIPLENVLKEEVTLVPTPDSVDKRNEQRRGRNLLDLSWEDCFEKCPTDNLLLVALNPIKGFREDHNTTSYRSFLVELDYGPLKTQVDYIKQIGIPYSALVFSGGKSIHCLITLDQDIPDYESYYTMAEWILSIATMADPNTKNPSRSIRIPGAEREPGKRQLMVEYKGTTKLADLAAWLAKHPDAKPKKQERANVSEHEINLELMKPWVLRTLGHLKEYGVFPSGQSRNRGWFAISCEFALMGYEEDDTLDMLSTYFTPDRDFKEREWRTAIRSAFKYIYQNRK